MGAIEIAVLGPVRVLVDGIAVPLPSERQRVLLARLALEQGHTVSVSRLIDALWPSGPPESAQGSLQSHVSRLRKMIGADRLVHEPGGYRLTVEPAHVDVGVAEALAAKARALAPDDAAGAADLLGDALALWRGEPLADLPERLAFAPDIAHLGAWRRQLFEDRAELRLAAGGAAAAIPDLERTVAADPLRERAVELLARALHDVGRTADALAAVSSYRRLLVEETGLDPGPALGVLEERILTEDPDQMSRQPDAVTASARSTHAPADLFVGRGDDLARVQGAVARHRLVTVVGPGGVGKTRLVRELLDDLGSLGRDLGGTTTLIVELAGVRDADEVPAATAAALGLASAPSGTVDAVVDRLGGASSLVVVDNCEHVRGGVAALATTLLARCPALRLLATSRRRLDVAGERVVRLAPLPIAAQVELFCDRAALLRSDFEDSVQARRVVAEICRHLDGLPLAVELAAQREPAFGLRQLRDGLVAGIGILDRVGVGDRSSGITPTAEWSYRLLDASARVLFDRLAVCADGFQLDALTHLAPDDQPADVLLAELVEASMVLADHGQDPPRYRILEPIRQMGEQHLDRAGRDAAEVAHADWMRRHVATARLAQDRRSPDAPRLLRRERSNLRQALRRAVERAAWSDAALLGIETALLAVDDPMLDVLDQLAQLDAVPAHGDVADDVRARCLAASGTARWLRGQADIGAAQCSAAVDLLPDAWVPLFLRCMARMFIGDVEGVDEDARTVRDHAAAPVWVRATVVCLAALMHEFSGDHDAAAAWLASHPDLLEHVSRVDGFVSYTRGELLAAQDPKRALRAFDLAEARSRSAGHEYNRRVAQVGRAGVLIRLGDDAAAVPTCIDALTSLRDAGMWPQIWMVLRLVAELLTRRGEPAIALALLDAADDDLLAPPLLEVDTDRITRVRAAAAQATANDGDGVESSGEIVGAWVARADAVRAALDALSRQQ